MQIEERVVNDVTILDLKGKITLGEGDEALKDKINSLIHAEPQADSAESRGRAVHRQRGSRRDRPDLHDGEPPGRPAQAGQPDQAHHGSAVDHQAADGLRDVRLGAGSAQELLVSARVRGGPAAPLMARQLRASASPALSSPAGEQRRGRFRRCSLLRVAAPAPVDEEPLRLRRPDLRRAAVRSARPRPRPASPSPSSALLSGVVYLVNDVRDRDADRLHPVKSTRPIASGALSPGAALAAATALIVAGAGAPRVLARRASFGIVAADLPGAARALLVVAQARRHPRRADARDGLRAARARRRGRDRRARSATGCCC